MTDQGKNKQGVSIRVIWFDDEIGQRVLRATQNRLKREFDLKPCASPNEITTLLKNKQEQFDVLLLDIIAEEKRPSDGELKGVPSRLFGLELLKLLRKGGFGDTHKNIPAVILTASTYMRDIKELERFVESDKRTIQLAKPSALKDIVEAIRDANEKSSSKSTD